MRTPIEILQDCVQKLKVLYSRSVTNPARAETPLAGRVLHIGTELKMCVDNHNVERAVLIIEDQLCQLGGKHDSNGKIEYSKILRSMDSPYYPMHRDSSYEGFCTCLIDTYRELQLSKVNVPIEGVAIIHRIWLGATPGEDRLTIMASGNKAIMKNWHDSSGKKVDYVHQILWTNNKYLLSMRGSEDACSLRGVEIRDIASILSGERELQQYVYAMIDRGEFALASDLLRFIILKFFGGLYLGMPWREAIGRIEPKNPFMPYLNTVRLLYMDTRKAHDDIKLGTAYSGLTDGYFALFEKAVKAKAPCSLLGIIDSDLTYVGAPGHPFPTHVVNIVKELLCEASKVTSDKYFAAFRRAKYKTVKEKWAAEGFVKSRREFSTSSSPSFKKSLSKMDEEFSEIISQPKNNVTIITHVFAICQAMVDLGYLEFQTKRSYTEHFTEKLYKIYPVGTSPIIQDEIFKNYSKHMAFALPPENRFQLEWIGGDPFTYCPILGICRMPSGSWARVSLKDKLSSESPL